MGNSRNENALENLLGAENELLEPVSRNEKLLHKLLGETIETDEPQSRIEILLKEMIDEGFQSEEDFYGDLLTAEYGSDEEDGDDDR